MTTFIHNVLNIIFLLMLICALITIGYFLIRLLIFLITILIGKHSKPNHQGIIKSIYLICIIFFTIMSSIIISQATATTPKIGDSNSISELRHLVLNGRSQWISIRGQNQDAPIILFLAGGPGGTQMASVRHELSKLEKHFVIVVWDQPGSGKSYNSGYSLTHDDYIRDGIELTNYLLDKFSREKIILLGESWGSYLGFRLAEKAPEKYDALITTGQMVSFLDTEIIDYKKAIELASKNGDVDIKYKMILNGKPPYYGKDASLKMALYLNYLTMQMNRNPEISNPGYSTFRDIFSTEYGILDKINFFRGLLFTFNDVYQQLYEYDLRETTPKIEVPILMLIGKHDLNAPIQLTEEYYEMLDAPYKSFVWFEHSGHNPWIKETEKFVDEVIKFKSLLMIN